MDDETLENILILSKQICDEYDELVNNELKPFLIEIEAIKKAIAFETDTDKKLEFIKAMVQVTLQMEDARAELYQHDKVFKYTLGRMTGKI